MKIVICEDEKIFSNQLSEYIKEWSQAKSILIEIFHYYNAESFLYDWAEDEDYDLIFLDIKMNKMTGFELAKFIRKTNNYVQIVFITSMKEYVFKGYSVDAMQYLLKPVEKIDCFKCLEKAHKSFRIKKYYILKNIDKVHKIPLTNIIYIEMFSHIATMVTTMQKYEFRRTITKILEDLEDSLFIKCHKSYIVNIRHIESLSRTSAIMSNNSEIPISKNMINEINEKFIRYNTHKM